MATKFHEHVKRSIAKALTFRLVVVISDIFIVFALTDKVEVAVGLIFFSNFARTIIYFLHERFWNSIHWGKDKK